ncbi:T9SS type A sorting domain-containing protein [Hanstruepera ponticola]|uniref:T9SS type A sorting domain-containing protein n=1 Tax=Hanstruepera ponticola TaxID=2042995 RepID=UPI0017801F2F|nr:T9SS type A sorting domain-containing protein [Hanstruepera ponticola]
MKQLLLLFFLLPFFAFSQCPPDGTFSSQAEIDAFATEYPDCAVLESSLVISGDDITSLNGLEQIGQVSRLIIQDNPLLLNLDGLNQNLIINSFFGELTIQNNPVLTNINALEFVTDGEDIVEGEVDISDNPMLNDLYGFPLNLDAINQLIIDNNDSLTNLEGLGGISGIQSLFIQNNDSLLNLIGLEEGFHAVNLIINNNLSLQSLDGLIYPTYITQIAIENNQSLTNVSALNAILANYSIDHHISILNNPNLAICDNDWICSFIEYNQFDKWLPGNFHNNASGCENDYEVEYNCGFVTNDDCTIYQYPDVDNNLTLGETITATNQLATTSEQVPSCNEVADRQDVWFIFNSGDSSTVDILLQSGFNLQLWNANSGCGYQTQVSEACGSEQLLDIPVTQDTNYFIQVWSDNNKRPAGWFDLTVQDGLLSNTEYAFNELRIYPNPVNTSLNIKAYKPIDGITIHNLLGQEVMKSLPNSINAKLNLESLNSGIYIVQITIEEQQKTYKIIKE